MPIKHWFGNNLIKVAIIALGILMAVSFGFFIKSENLVLAFLPFLLVLTAVYLILIFKYPVFGLYLTMVYCFLLALLSREIGGIQYGIGVEILLLLTWLATLFYAKINWPLIKLDLVWLLAVWFIISVLEIANPSGASIMGWVQEVRSTALYPLLIVPLALLLIDNKEKVNWALFFVIGMSTLASLNGIKQLYIGPSAGEQRFLDEGGALTHVLFGQLRVFSFYTDAGQFGASQAHICMLCVVLAFCRTKWWKKVLLLLCAALLFYGMLISGTRGALFALLVAAFFALLLSKNYKILLVGGILVLGFVGMLKFTYLGNSNYQIYRLRTAVDPQDASLNIRIQNQAILRDYLKSKPFGDGLGVIGTWGKEYNADKFLSTVEPDSYWVKVWAMYGIVGLTIWFSIMMYILGKCCGIVWMIKDYDLRIKSIALTAGTAGILFCSYGNEVMNAMPSAIILCVSWAVVFKMPWLENPDT
ncbi:O-antigen ligase family protein [Olivibacter ginsenosidimutans]|uniref:O-antigen ligase family protein n=1 Tax=Olivibacter ginsenosidimutans TaxID=1176537 RepID=UPI0031EA229E